MPHLILDYTPALDTQADMASLCNHLRRAMIDTGTFPMAGVRVRAHPAAYVSMADGGGAHMYLHLQLRIGAGRDAATRAAASKAVFDAACAFLAPVTAAHSLAISCELVEIDPATSHKSGTTREHLARNPT